MSWCARCRPPAWSLGSSLDRTEYVVSRPTIRLTERSEGKSITHPQPRISSTLAQGVPGTIAQAFPSALHPALELGGADMGSAAHDKTEKS